MSCTAILVFLALLVSLTMVDGAEPQTAADRHSGKAHLLVVITGESNSGGYALNTEATAAELAPRPATRILDNRSLAAFEDLRIGSNNLVGHTRLENGATHGFELELANRVDTRASYVKPCYLVKTGQGGSTIAQWATDGEYYRTFVARVKAARSLLQGQRVRPVILFSLGINDAIAGTDTAVWKKAVAAHFAQMRKELGDDTPIVMTKFMPRYKPFNDAIDELCKSGPGIYCVDSTAAPLRDENHWNYAGMKLVAGRMLDIVEALTEKRR